MLFNSLEFPVFLVLVFTLYWALGPRNTRIQNLLLILTSYVFYGWWDWRFLGLIVLSSLVDFLVGLVFLSQPGKKVRNALLLASLAVNLGALGFFKYFNFFADSFQRALGTLGLHTDWVTLQIVLPVGISFYTFQTLSYTIDIYRGKLTPIRDPVAFFAFVAFFPQLVAGPIERAQKLLPQFLRERGFDPRLAADGLKQMLWGFVKKVVVADNLAPFVDTIFASYDSAASSAILLGTFFFAIQIYCDFSGYSDIAIGTGRLFGFSLSRNFAFPYFSRNIGEFWHRWHISLSTWFRDYVYIPLGGSRCPLPRRLWNVLVTFVVSGLWHGANWTFVVWGLVHGGVYAVWMVVTTFVVKHRGSPEDERLPAFRDAHKILATFAVTLLAWLFFRAESLTQAVVMLGRVFSPMAWRDGTGQLPAFELILVILVLLVEWLQRDKQHALQFESGPVVFRWACYATAIFFLLVVGRFSSTEFIYFQF